jgi:hypothetical protein
MAYTQDDLIKDLARDVQVAEHAYQLALGNGDPHKIRDAKRFWTQCDTEYQLEKRDWFKRQKRK